MLEIKRSQLSRVQDPRFFLWATGIEDTFIIEPHPRTGRTLEEYELTGHYKRWEQDIDLMAGLGVPAARYGIPWYKVQPTPDRWDWTWSDQVFERMLDRGIMPIVDLVHYGTPRWLEQSFLNPDYAMRVAEYAAAAADRYRGRIYWYTPLNEPRINAWYCGRLGWWPPFLRSWKGFVAVLLGICRGIVETCHALHRVDPEIVLAHVDASDRFLPLDEGARELADFRQELVFLALDLVSGRVDEAHALYAWLLEHDADEDLLDSFRERPVELDLIGANLYPMFTLKHVQSVQNNKLRLKMKYADGSLASEICEMYYRRYQKPVWISETASAGSVRKREKWMRESIAAVRTSRMAGVPLMGYTWWPMFSLVAWAYRQQHRPVEDYLLHMGLWDLSEDGQLERQETNLVQMYRQYIERGHEDVGLLVTES